jgi:16S rRNA (cytidine1402-2'-O)-methyltransferase
VAGRLVLVATPIGNLGDLSPRARAALAAADLWIVEDSRVSGRLRTLVGSSAPMRVLNDHSGADRVEALAQAVAAGQTVALVSDAGSPVVSDPGAELVDKCHALGLEVDSVPGPSAVTDALALSGFYAQRFAFLGFLPRKPGPARDVLSRFTGSSLTLVLFESPHRLVHCLAACAEALGERRFAVCRELTKLHQQVWRGTLPEAPTESQVPRKGEFTIVVEGLRKGNSASDRSV